MAGIFQATRGRCLVVRVTVLRGENIRQGWFIDLVDKADPFVKLDLPNSPNGRRQTTVISNDNNPTWNETFQFYMDPELDNVMNVTLMEEDPVFHDPLGQTIVVHLNNLKYDIDHEQDLVFNKTIHVFIKIHIAKCTEIPKGVRLSTKISDKEIEFRQKRKEFVFNTMKEVLAEKGPKNINEVPTVAILGSGGGYRAMTALSGTFCALKDIGIVDCSMYFAGVSGSTWYISTLYSHPNWPKIHPVEVNKELRKSVDKSFARLIFNPAWLKKRISDIKEKKRRGEPISYTDFFGYLLGDTLLADRDNPLLSSQQKTFQDGTVPMPLYACIHVKNDVGAEVFHDWLELSPFEVGMLRYGTYLTPENFGNKYFGGACVAEYPEAPLHFIQGICGSGFAVLTDELKSKIRSSITGRVHNEEDDEERGDDTQKHLNFILETVDKIDFLSARDCRAPEVLNFLRGMDLEFNPQDHTKEEIASRKEIASSQRKRLMFADGGIAFNSPYPLLLRTDRQVDLFLSFEYSGRRKDDFPLFTELVIAEQWAKKHNYPFPPINHEEQFKKYGPREYYVFKDDNDPSCPVVIHFPLVNNLFKTFKAPGVRRVTPKELEAGKLSIFEDHKKPYNLFRFHYGNETFDRLVELSNFNVKVCKDVIWDELAKCVEKKRQ
ncbi:cytosolic phospholipase A2 [Exaiptasia diaphana]|uniref:Phospholipase A2 n=1 Tax=Exaiptasia diaphana TaxID=2652724 RepID=A0A913XA18_EXADI|nr:cytosolic phospholipase A2 [Exaiptasia diaphana]